MNQKTVLMKKPILLFLTLILSVSLFSQSLSPTVIASAGGFAAAGGYSISQTIGELAVKTLTNNDLLLTQGFQQPQLSVANFIEPEEVEWSLNTYPNPVKDMMYIEYSLQEETDLMLEIRDITGKKVSEEKLEQLSGDSETSVNLSDLRNGIYFLKFYSPDKKLFKIIKIQKI